MIEIQNLICDYKDGDGQVVRGVTLPSFQLRTGEACAVTGPSGSGKSTLFHCLAGILTPTQEEITIDGVKLGQLSDQERAKWRAQNLGYVFQEAKLLPFLTIEENIKLSASLAGRNVDSQEVEKRLSQVGLSGYGSRRPEQLSGGERQRAAFVRAMIRRPKLLLADEPTASLDAANSQRLLELLLVYQNESGCMLLCASHDQTVQNRFHKKLELHKEAVR